MREIKHILLAAVVVGCSIMNFTTVTGEIVSSDPHFPSLDSAYEVEYLPLRK